jgi:hypothetical protein
MAGERARSYICVALGWEGGEMDDKPPIWDSFLKALCVEPRPDNEIVGDSGLTHQVQAIGVDDATRRVVIISAEYNPRIAALMRVDVQATMPGARVLVARPLAIDIAHTTRSLFTTKSGSLDLMKVLELANILGAGQMVQPMLEARYGDEFRRLMADVGRSNLPIRSHFLNLIEQAANINWSKIKDAGFTEASSLAFEVVEQVAKSDNLAGDRKHGVCPVPTYELTEKDWDLFGSGRHIDEVQERLKALNIYQYFYPPADSVALGLIDRDVGTEAEIQKGFDIAEKGGHVLSKNELLPEAKDLPELLEALKAQGYVAEGEYSYEATEEGRTVRKSVKVRPRESFLTKIINRINLNASISPKDFIPPGTV